MPDKSKRAVRRYLNRKYRTFRKHLKVRECNVSLAAQHWEHKVMRSWSGIEELNAANF